MTTNGTPPTEEPGLASSQSILDSIGDTVVVLDANGVIVAKNAAWDRFCRENGGGGKSVDLGANYLEACRGALEESSHAGEVLEGVGSLLEGRSEVFTLEYPCHSGTEERWFLLRATPHRNAKAGVVLTHTDVTPRHRAEELVRRGRAEVSAIVRTAVDGIVTIDARGRVESFNPAAERMFGFAESELIGKNVNTIMPQPYRAEHDGYLERYLDTGQAHIIGTGREVVGLRKDGTTFPLWLSVGEQDLEGSRKFTGILHDLTSRKRDQQQGGELARIIDESLNEIFVFDAETLLFMQVNEGARRNLGYSMEEMEAMTPVDIKPDHTEATFGELVQPLLSGAQRKVMFETRHRRKDGSLYDVEVHLQLGHLESRAVFVAIILDTTLRRDQARKLAQWNEELQARVAERTSELERAHESLVQQERLATLGQLSGGVAHEIRNPLGVIGNTVYYLQSLLDGMPPEAKECIEDIAREVETANRIVGELLDYARQPDPVTDRFCLQEALLKAAASVEVPDSITVVAPEPNGAKMYVTADSGQIERTLANFVRNAVQAMAASSGGELRLRCHEGNGEVVAEVGDTGPGIAPEDLERVFEPLYTSKAKGIGLGLAVATRYAEPNGARIEAESSVGGGSVFRLRVPAAASEAN